jgi:transcriptional regulator with XRE-family HTH domain
MAGTKKSKKAAKKIDEPQQIPEKVAARLRALRLQRGYTSYEQFALDNDLNRSLYGKYERGADMRISTLIRLCAALDITPDEFFKGIKF